MSLSIDLCRDWRKIGEAPAHTFAGVSRHLAMGEWSLTGAVASLDLSTAVTVADVNTIRIVDGQHPVFGGFVTPVDSSGAGGLRITRTPAGSTFEMSGPDLWALLAWRFAYPDPTTEAPWAVGHDTRSGAAATVAADFIEANAGASALTARQYPNLVVTDSGAGSTGTWSARLQRLDELVARICGDGGITCRLSIAFDGIIEARLEATSDLSATTVLHDDGDLTDIVTVSVPAAATDVLAGGQGELELRTFAVSSSGLTGTARRERFADQSGLADLSELASAAAATAREHSARASIAARLADRAAQQLVYLADYRIGDMLGAQVDGVRYASRVDAVSIQIDASRQVIRPVFGDLPTDDLSGLLANVAQLQAQFRTKYA